MAAFGSFESTREIPIPRQPLEQIVGQDEAVRIAYIAAKQRRNLLLVGPPGTGKSLLAQAISFHLPRPTEEVNVLHNPETPERPLVEVRTLEQIEKEKRMMREVQGRLVTPQEVPAFVAERLGFACRRCGQMSSPRHPACQSCGGEKFLKEQAHSPFGDLVNPYFEDEGRQDRVHTTRLDPGGREEVVVYERADDRRVRVLDQAYLEKMDSLRKKTPRKTLAPISRRPFVVATGASETELLGDVRHDPYGGHPALGTPPYLRVVPGAVHEAHEGVLFIDEISALAYIQRFLLTAMQEKKYPIVGRNPHGAGASVKVENAPCDFLLIAASNINDIPNILPPLRSRILGNGYEVLLQTTMADSAQNRAKLAQFAAQEVRKDGRIPHFSRGGIEALIGEARRRAKTMDKTDAALTLRLRELSGIIRLAGDIAKISGKELADAKDVTLAVERGRSIEEQLTKRYGSLYKASMGDVGAAEPSEGKEVS
ncbi:ATP-binding protein [Candidatus Micrarchaeota archaeon]|nr:ATP-binding protein [Candidatus Micrarchaeota archaeon]MBI5177596.1 ATP-binding protein [Candidatus Micrarchaeota archaeon]